MEKKEKFFQSSWYKIALLVIVVLAGFSIRTFLDHLYDDMQNNVQKGSVQVYEDGTRVGRELNYAENVPDDNNILQIFKEAFPEATVMVACEEDVTNDGCNDLVIVYQTLADDEHGENTVGKHEHVRLIVAIDSGDGENYVYTEPVAAPVENQKIKFQNIDKADEMEFIVQGQKDNKVGYGIFRVMDGATVNLFAEGMEEC